MNELVELAPWVEIAVWLIILATGLMTGFAMGWAARDSKYEKDAAAWIKIKEDLELMTIRETKG